MRENGFYWVKLFGGDWIIAEYNHSRVYCEQWMIAGNDTGYSDEEIEVIGDKIETTGKYR